MAKKTAKKPEDIKLVRAKALAFDTIMERQDAVDNAADDVRGTNAEHQTACNGKKEAEKSLSVLIKHYKNADGVPDMFDMKDANPEGGEES